MQNTYFVSVIAAFAENPKILENMFINKESNKQGLFGVMIYKNGLKQQLLLDSYIPTKSGRPVFLKSNKSEVWQMLLDKAWAKVHGSYAKVQSGQPYEVFRDFTGAPGYYLKSNESGFWEAIQECVKEKYLIVAT